MGIKSCPDDRWTWVEVDRAALRTNFKNHKNLLPSKTKIMAVVKADAYGHGAVECAKVFKAAGAQQFAVATVEEGRILRQAGIQEPILVLGMVPQTGIEELLTYDLMPSVQTIEFALALGEAAVAHDKIAKYHLVLDTGMTRNGIDWRDVIEFRDQIDFHRGLECAGTYTHFATADTQGDWDFELQHSHFKDAIEGLRTSDINPGLVHCANMAATVMHPETHYDMVRLGIGLYGLYAAPTFTHRIDLVPAMSVHARITRVVYPAVGSGVSYGMKWRVPKSNVQVATIPLGYADGYPRILSGKVDVLCGGKRRMQVGNICMDHCMFAVEVNPQRQFGAQLPVEWGEEVVVMGTQDSEQISADELAAHAQTINYEIVSDFGMRLERVYV